MCIKTTTLNDDVTVPKGAMVLLPLYVLQHEAKYWDDPEKFNPDRLVYLTCSHLRTCTILTLSLLFLLRFTAEERAKRPTTVHMPFGFGPRNCIGMRFALLEAKIALMELLKRYTFVRAPDTEVRGK